MSFKSSMIIGSEVLQVLEDGGWLFLCGIDASARNKVGKQSIKPKLI